MALPVPPVFARGDYEWRLMLRGYAKGAFIVSRELSYGRLQQLIVALAAAYPLQSANQLVTPMIKYLRQLFTRLVFHSPL
jgi:hypothetical protein